jgi:diguanylate cyclase (GGDEF)-like protein
MEKRECDDIERVLSIVSKALSVRQISKERILETQIINQLNLNVITTLDENKIIKNLESAARQMLNTEHIYLFYVKDDTAIGSEHQFKLTEIPKGIFTRIFDIHHMFTLRKDTYFSKVILGSSNTHKLLCLPFTVKTTVRGFFIIFDKKIEKRQRFAITRLKFLTNQAALALERIDLFRALKRAVAESQSLQDLIKLMLSSIDISSLFKEILERAQKLLGFKRILFSLYEKNNSSFCRITGVGISQRMLKRAQAIHPPLEVINDLFSNRFRISNSYYIPSADIKKAGTKIRKYKLYRSPVKQCRIGQIWDPGDIFISPIYSKTRELVGLLSLDLPVNNRIPSYEKTKLLETFGDFLGMVIENAQLFEKIERLSNTDEMTGVYNYRFLREKISLLTRQKKLRRLALVMIDLDKFKHYNDKYGHLYGDEILRKFSHVLLDMVDDKAFVIRYGGDEFIILLENTPLRKARSLARKIQIHLRDHSIVKGKIPLNFSYGIALYPTHGSDLGELIDHADRSLYRQKQKK